MGTFDENLIERFKRVRNCNLTEFGNEGTGEEEMRDFIYRRRTSAAELLWYRLRQRSRYVPIGVIHSPFKEPSGVPIQASAAEDTNGTVEVFPEFADGLKDIEGFSHIILLYHFHLTGKALQVKPYMDDQLRGVFATRAPSRPNPIGMSIVRLLRVEGERLHMRDVDVVDGTPFWTSSPMSRSSTCGKRPA